MGSEMCIRDRGQWWTEFQETDERGQERMLTQLGSDGPKKRRRKKPAKKA